ncbi:MAG TPA: sodium:solute symporter [Vicinamibacterales bacterium]|nr:sodium:solute symporter [Vicinamibacterales bacterium]
MRPGRMNQHFTAIDWAVWAVYFAATMGVGFYSHRYSRSTEGFTAASRSLPGWACGLSIFATYLSSISFLALPGKAYVANWNPFVFSLSLPVATWAAARYFLPYYRRSGEVSAYAHLERRFGPWARVYASLFYLLTQLARMGAVMFLMAMPLSILLGWDLRTIILVTGISVTVYSFVGGIVAVIWTDAMQSIVLMAGAGVCAITMLLGMPDGPGQLFEIAARHDKFSLGSYGLSLTEPTFWVVLLYGATMNLQNFGIDQSYIQRYIASRSHREARKSIWLGGLLYLPVSALFFFIGTALFAFYQAHPASLDDVRAAVAVQQVQARGLDPRDAAVVAEVNAGLTDADIGDKVFPHFIGAELPPGVTGLVIAAIFAAAMSTLSTSLNSSATLLMRDYYQRYVNRTATERQSMSVLYAATVIWGMLGTGLALAMIHVQSALDAWWTLSGIFSGGMLGLVLLGMVSRRARNPAAVTAVIAGISIVLWMTLSLPAAGNVLGWGWPAGSRSPLHEYLIPVVGTLTILLCGLLVGRLAASGPAARSAPGDEDVAAGRLS